MYLESRYYIYLSRLQKQSVEHSISQSELTQKGEGEHSFLDEKKQKEELTS